MKYILIKENSIQIGSKTLYKIQAVKNFGYIKKGDLGGYVESEANLSQEGNSWIHGEAKVYGSAGVGGNTRVFGDVEIYGNAKVYGDSTIWGNARVYGDAWVYENARVEGNTRVWGNARVAGEARVYGDAKVSWEARVNGDARITGDVEIDSSDRYINLIGVCKYPITVTYKNIVVGCKVFELEDLKKDIENKEFSKKEIDTIKLHCGLALATILKRSRV